MRNFFRLTAIAFLLAFAVRVNAAGHCFAEAANYYGIPEQMLRAIAKTESNFRADAINVNSNGTSDIGVMQINSGWLNSLSAYGIGIRELRDPCTNIKVGAWILSKNAEALGWNWDAIGAYNVGCKKLSASECQARRNKYAWKIHATLHRLDGSKGERVMSAPTKLVVVPTNRAIMMVRLNEIPKPIPEAGASAEIEDVQDKEGIDEAQQDGE